MSEILPPDLRAFLAAGRQLEFDSESSHVGRIRLATLDELAVEIASIETGDMDCGDLDPYGFASGQYEVPAVSLVVESEDYDPFGILGWLPDFSAYASWDLEHGTLITFPGAAWVDIVASPLDYLDEQWNSAGLGVEPFLWLSHSFTLEESLGVFPPHQARCTLHSLSLVERPPGGRVVSSEMANTLRGSELEQYVDARTTRFPFPGVPVSREQERFCIECRAAEEEWLAAQLRKPAIDVTPNQHGFVRCPGCEKSFNPKSVSSYLQGVHLSCGTKLKIVGDASSLSRSSRL